MKKAMVVPFHFYLAKGMNILMCKFYHSYE